MVATKNFNYDPKFYDIQVNWENRLAKERPFFEPLFKRYKPRSLLDIGCGTAHHAEMFSNYVDEVTAIDPDSMMIDHARENVIKAANISLLVGGFEGLENLFDKKFDMIVSLGNTLTILGTKKKVKAALKSVKKVLAPGGVALFQFLNYEPKVLAENRYYRPKVFSHDDKKYIFMKHFEYGKKKTTVDFIISVLDPEGKLEEFYVNTSKLCTLRKNIFLKMAKNCNYRDITLLGPGGIDVFDKDKDISLYALMSKSPV